MNSLHPVEELEFWLGEKFCFKNITNSTHVKIKYDELLQYQINLYCQKKKTSLVLKKTCVQIKS